MFVLGFFRWTSSLTVHGDTYDVDYIYGHYGCHEVEEMIDPRKQLDALTYELSASAVEGDARVSLNQPEEGMGNARGEACPNFNIFNIKQLLAQPRGFWLI